MAHVDFNKSAENPVGSFSGTNLVNSNDYYEDDGNNFDGYDCNWGNSFLEEKLSRIIMSFKSSNKYQRVYFVCLTDCRAQWCIAVIFALKLCLDHKS